jgi:hypothetical protein
MRLGSSYKCYRFRPIPYLILEFSISVIFKFQTEIFISNFKNENFQKISFVISKMKFSHFLFQILWYISIFSFPSGGMANYFQISKSIFSNFSHFPLVVWLFFFKNTKFQFISNFRYDINEFFFSTRRCLIY